MSVSESAPANDVPVSPEPASANTATHDDEALAAARKQGVSVRSFPSRSSPNLGSYFQSSSTLQTLTFLMTSMSHPRPHPFFILFIKTDLYLAKIHVDAAYRKCRPLGPYQNGLVVQAYEGSYRQWTRLHPSCTENEHRARGRRRGGERSTRDRAAKT